MTKTKLSIEDIITDMKSKNISFNYVTEEQAKDFLSTHTYYFKFKSYAKNYFKNPTTKKYSSLDFSYLQDLSRLDMHFRELVFKMTVDVEHLLRVQIMNASQNNTADDGYTIVKDFLSDANQKQLKDNIEKKVNNLDSSGYNTALIKNNHPNMPIWVLLEILSLGELIHFYEFYTSRFPIGNNVTDYLWSVRIMRNAAAHNSCILNKLTERTSEDKVNYVLKASIKKTLPFVDSKKLKQYQMNPVVQDFMDILMVFRILDKSRSTLSKRVEDIETFFERCRKNKDYYSSNPAITSTFKFVNSFVVEYKNSL